MSQTPQTPADDRLFVNDGFDAELFWARHRSSVIIGVIVVVAVVVGTAFWFINAHNTKLASEELFATAKSPEGWREVIAKYPTTDSAANAYFLLAESQREQGNLPESTMTFEKFLEVFPEHELAGGARLGLAENLLVGGKSAEALAALKDVQTKSPNSYAAPFAALLEGRLYLRDGKFAEARHVFTSVTTTYPNSPAASVASAQIEQITLLVPPDAAKPATP